MPARSGDVDAPPCQRWAVALLRLAACSILLEHGTQKLFGTLGGFGPNGGPGSLSLDALIARVRARRAAVAEAAPDR